MGKKKKGFQWSEDAPEPPVDLRPSRRALKREDDARKRLVKELLTLGPLGWKGLDLSEPLQAALEEAHRLKSKGGVRGGLRRQLLAVAAALRNEDTDSITEALRQR